MNASRMKDITLNVITPLSVGSLVYCIDSNQLIRFFLPDGLWAYSVISALLIVWDREFSAFWLCIAASTFVCFETLQLCNVIQGTGDPLDVITYTFFGLLPILFNYRFKKSLNYYQYENKY